MLRKSRDLTSKILCSSATPRDTTQPEQKSVQLIWRLGKVARRGIDEEI